jgi:hypothetical protein
MKTVTPGFTVPEQRFAPLPFYYRNQSPVIYRWDQLNWSGAQANPRVYDPLQRWFYENFTGRTHGSIWRYEQGLQVEGSANGTVAQGDWTDTKAWTLPNYVITGNTIETAPFNNYLDLSNNTRPNNPYTGRPATPIAADELYMAPRITGDRMAMRFDARLPLAASLETANTYYGIGWEINSHGGRCLAALEMYNLGAGTFVGLTYVHPAFNSQAGGRYRAATASTVILHPDHFCQYYMELDPPVLRFWQPIAGQTSAFEYPAPPIELSCPSLPSNAVMQPMVFNESNWVTKAQQGYEFYLGTWANWQLHRQSNTYQVNNRVCGSGCCGCSIYSAIFDTGGRSHVHVNLKTNGCGCRYYIEHAETGLSQVAGNPEAQTWRRIDDVDYTGVTDTPAGEAGRGLFNASRFLRVRFDAVQVDDNAGSETIAYTANGNE